jgi:6-phosphogluconolactonase (cycloisomerase 2 family)
MGLRFLSVVAASLLLVFLLSCSSGSSSSGTGFLYVATQGDSLVTPFTIDLSTGRLSTNGKGSATGSTPSAMVVSSSGKVVFVANTGDNSITSYSINSDGTLATGSTAQCSTGASPVNMAVDSGGKFLFVTYLGSQLDPNQPSAICVFSINNTQLTQASVTTFAVPTPGPAGAAATPDAKFLYVSNRFDNSVTQYSVDGSGNLATFASYPAGTSPAGMALVTAKDTTFLYVANTGSNTVSGYAVCLVISSLCANADGTLVSTGNPFSVQLGPVAMAATSDAAFLFVVDQQSNQVSQLKIAGGSGVLSANAPATVSTGLTPSWAAIRKGVTAVTTTGGTTDYLYVPNLGASTVSVYSYDSTKGVLSVDGQSVSTGGQPSSVATQ